MVYDLLIRTRYDSGGGRSTSHSVDKFRFGIERLIQNGAYTAAYPLHEPISYHQQSKVELESCSDRQFLYETWVQWRNLAKYQPLHLIKDYFGTKVGTMESSKRS